MKKVIRTMKGGKGGEGRAKRFMKKSSSGKEYAKLNSNVKDQVSARVKKKIKKYSDDITNKTKKTQKLKESIQKNKKKGFWGRIKNLLTFKQTRIDWKTKTIKQTENKLTEVEKLNNAIKTIDQKNEATKKAAETKTQANEMKKFQNGLLKAVQNFANPLKKNISNSLNKSSET